ncbi:MAG: SpaA isopeptide-forming pilin-related protein, partial [Oscillospiraceae bacterium]|nr:SpaA isopeptide-forming pilin-related protein [Oscillospiraceae bacterium]
MTKRITALFLTLVTLLSCIAVPANAASTLEEAMAEVNVYARNDDLDWLRVNGAVKTQHYTYYLYRSEQTGQAKEIPAYCTDPRLYGVPALVPEGTSIKYGADGTVSDPKIMGICANGYPHIDLATLGVQSVEEAYYATKTALWCYLLSTWDISKLSVNPNADQAAAQRVLKATQDIYYRGMQWDKLVEPKLTATPDRDTAYAATVNGESVYQQIFTVTSETWSIEPVVLSLASGAPSGTKILDMSNNEVSRLNIANATHGDDGYTWQVKVVYPALAVAGEDGTVQLNMNSVVVQYELFHAKCLETDVYGNAQRYVLDTDPHTPIAASAISTYSSAAPSETPTPSSGETAIKIRKLEKGTNTPLAGAVFEVKYPDGSAVGSASTGSDGTVTIPVTVTGNYTVTETASAKNHLLPDVRTQSVTVTHGHTATVTFTNAPYGGIRVEKVSDTGEKLGGVTVQIKHIATGATQSAQTNSAGVAEFSQLPIGGYEVRETAGIEGWQFDGDTVQTVAVTTGETSTVTFVNKELPGLRIVKYDRTTLQTLSNVTFEIFRDGTSIGRYTTDAMGEIVFTDAAPGTYLVKEIQSTDTHITDTTPQEIELQAGDGIRQLVFYNDLKPGIHLVKVDSADLSKPIANAKFSIRAVDGSYGPIEFTTGADGTIDLSRLPTGVYVVTELSCPGYVIDDAQRIIHLDGNENAEFVFTNSIRPTIHIVKLSSDGTPLPGVAFRIARIADGSHYLDRVTDQNGEITISNLDPGVYSVHETSTTADHVLDLREFHVELFAGKTSTLVVENQKRPNLIVYKYDADTGEPIADTVFKVSAADGHSVDELRTDRNGRATLANLLPGVYEIAEKAVPNDWLLDAPSELVTLYANRDHTAYFYNHKKPSITVRKVSSVTGDLLEGAKFHVEYASNNTTTGERNDLGYFYTGEDGTFTLTHQRDGWYKITEVTPPTGYAISEAAQEFYLAAGKNKTITFEDVPLSALVVYKYDTVTGEAVKDAVFQLRYLTDTSGTGGTVIGRYVTSANGSFAVTGLKRGTYVVEELASDSGHVIDTAPQTAFISGNDQDVVQLYFGNAPKGSVLITKKDALTLAPLSGVAFTVTDSNGAFIGDANGKFTTDASGSILIDNLDPGTALIVKESRAISGYILDDAPQAVQIRSGKTVELEFLNQPKGNLIIEKYDAVTKERLAGAVFRITDASGRLLADNEGLTSTNGLYTTNAEGQIVLSKVDPTTLVVTEVTAPDNYKLDSTPQTVVIGAGDTQTLRFYDEPLCTLTIAKRDAVTKAPLKGAEFTVKYSDGTYVGTDNGRFITGTDGTVTVSGLKPNATVVVTETKAPLGYLISESAKSVVVRSGVANSLTFDDEPATTLVIRKYIEGTDYEPLAGVAFKVTDGSGAAVGPDDGVYYTDKAGEIVLTGLEPGITVKAREIKTVEGYILDGTPQDILIEAGTVQQLTFWNAKQGTLVIRKLSGADRKTPLAGAEFQLTYADGRYVDNANGKLSSNGIYRTDSNGEIRITGVTGTIVAIETRSPDGYSIGTDRTQTVVVRSGETQTLTFYNDPFQTVVIQKYIDGTTRPLAGVTFLLTDGNGNPIGNGEYVTDANGRITLTAPVGTTIVARETKTVSGYVLNTTPQTITVTGSGSAQTVTMPSAASSSAAVVSSGDGTTGNQLTFYDSAIGKLELIKVDAANRSKRLANATFEIRRMDQGVVTTVTTDRNGRAVAELDAGSYYA